MGELTNLNQYRIAREVLLRNNLRDDESLAQRSAIEHRTITRVPGAVPRNSHLRLVSPIIDVVPFITETSGTPSPEAPSQEPEITPILPDAPIEQVLDAAEALADRMDRMTEAALEAAGLTLNDDNQA